ncbi:MAG: Ig-like domain-containing protein, partial [Caldilineaceae bacterium]|nr:Ig-like domain-containing protein [Caldilineaceae bacterium]
TLGDAVDAAKRDLMAHSTAWHDLRLTYALLGDPAMVVRLPPLPPTVTGQFPEPGGTGIALDTPVTVTFHKRMDPATVTISGLPGPVSTPAWDATNTRLTVTPDAWQPGTRYTLRVHGSDAGGLPLSPDDRPLEWSFATAADRQSPDIDAALSALAQDETAPITLHFSEAVRPASLVLELTPAWPPRPDAEPGEDAEPGPMVQWTGDFTSVTLVHGGLATGINYRLSVTVTDVAGNRVDPPVRFSFTPGAPAQNAPLFLPLVVR